MENTPNENNKLSSQEIWCRHGVNRGICQDCNLRKSSGFPEQNAKVPYRIEGELNPGDSATWQFDTAVQDRPKQLRSPLPESALLFRARTSREDFAVRRIVGDRKLKIFTRHGCVELSPGMEYELLAAILADLAILNNRKIPHDSWWVWREVDRLLPEKVAKLAAAYEEAAKKTDQDRASGMGR